MTSLDEHPVATPPGPTRRLGLLAVTAFRLGITPLDTCTPGDPILASAAAPRPADRGRRRHPAVGRTGDPRPIVQGPGISGRPSAGCGHPTPETALRASPGGKTRRSASQPDARPKGFEPLTF